MCDIAVCSHKHQLTYQARRQDCHMRIKYGGVDGAGIWRECQPLCDRLILHCNIGKVTTCRKGELIRVLPILPARLTRAQLLRETLFDI